MKKLMLRLRHWLIKKLGGYTEQMAPPTVRYPPRVTLHPERVFAQQRVCYEMLLGVIDRTEELTKAVKYNLACTIVDEIIAKGMGVLTCEPDRSHGMEESVYTMMLCIVPPNEWVKTELGEIVKPSWERGV